MGWLVGGLVLYLLVTTAERQQARGVCFHYVDFDPFSPSPWWHWAIAIPFIGVLTGFTIFALVSAFKNMPT